VLAQYRDSCNWASVLRPVLASFSSQYVSANATDMVATIKAAGGVREKAKKERLCW
jgi:hypothetical protein